MTLSDLYHFKKNDTWGQVFEGQAKADAIREVVERQQKEVKMFLLRYSSFLSYQPLLFLSIYLIPPSLPSFILPPLIHPLSCPLICYQVKNGTYGQQLKRQLDDLHAKEAEYARTDVHFTQVCTDVILSYYVQHPMPYFIPL